MTEDRPRALIAGVYPLALLLILMPMASVAITVSPLRFGEVTWRYGAFGIVMQSTTLPLLGVALVCLAAYLLGHHVVLRIVAALALLLGVLLAGAVALFALDALRMRPMVQPAAMEQFGAKTTWAGFAAALTALVLVWIGIGAWRVPLPEGTAAFGRAGAKTPRTRPALIDDSVPARPRDP